MISAFHNAEVQDSNKQEARNRNLPVRFITTGLCVCVCVIHYNKHMAGVDKKGQMLQMYLAEDENK